jgi:hypothetical protein
MRALAAVLLIAAAGSAHGDTVLTVDPDAGNNTFSAVFDAALGERITAVSAAVGCTLHVDEAARTGRATCSVPLTAIRVDNDDTKTEHFRQWATNGKGDARQCAIELSVDRVSVADPVEPMTPAPFSTEGTLTICGRRRDDRGAEKIGGTLTLLSRDVRTVRIRARIEGFDRERYRVGPKWTPGWLARVQELAPVVAADGTIEVTLFATEAASK